MHLPLRSQLGLDPQEPHGFTQYKSPCGRMMSTKMAKKNTAAASAEGAGVVEATNKVIDRLIKGLSKKWETRRRRVRRPIGNT